MSTVIKYDLLNAFNTKPFSGNRAAVALLDSSSKEKLDREKLYQAIAGEIAAPATAFVIPQEDGGYNICWWAPVGEINLCGHATLATSKILFDRLDLHEGGTKANVVNYSSSAGPLQARRLMDGRVELEFPAAHLIPIEDSFDDVEIKEINSLLGAALHDDGIEIVNLKRGKGHPFDHWLLAEIDLSKTAHQSLKEVEPKPEHIVSVLII